MNKYRFVVWTIAGIIATVLMVGCKASKQSIRSKESVGSKQSIASQSNMESILGPVELSYLQDALRCIKMTPQDLLYKKNTSPDLPYRLKAIDRMMANPIEVPFYTDNLARELSCPFYQHHQLWFHILHLAKEVDITEEWLRSQWEERSSNEEIYSRMAGSGAKAFQDVKNIPVDIKDSVFALLYSMSESSDKFKKSFANLLDEGKKNLSEHGDSFEVYQGYDTISRTEIVNASLLMAETIDAVLPQLKSIKPTDGVSPKEFGLDDSKVKGNILFYANTEVGEVVVGGSGPNEYNHDFALIIDLGGDDLYTCRAGGTDGRTQPPVAVCIDLGGNNQFIARMKTEPVKHEGEDKLEPGNDRIDFCQGGALAGIGILVVDGDGVNTFTAGNWSQGAAHLGVGILLRTGQSVPFSGTNRGTGNDTYKGLDCVQGAASFGIGAIIDDSGDDKYSATAYSQGFGGPAGIGLVLDRTGNDSYYAGGRYEGYPMRPRGSFIAMSQGFGYGLRPSCSGGIGILLDNSGDDLYHLNNQFGMGGSYWYGFGMLVDDAGNDTYKTGTNSPKLSEEELRKATENKEYLGGDYDGYTMGAAIHLAAACLIDRSGDDKYCGHKIAPAVGWDFSPAWLIDGGGTDLFSTARDWNRGLGSSTQNGCGFLVKKSGVARFEGYSVPSAWTERDCGGIGILLNLGKGEYDTVIPQMTPGAWWSGRSFDANTSWCAGIDNPESKPNASSKLDDWPRRELLPIEQKPKEAKAQPPAVMPVLPDDNVEMANALTPEKMDKLWEEILKELNANWDKSTKARDKFKQLGRAGLHYALLKQLTSVNSYESRWISEFIAGQGKAAVPVLMACLKSENDLLRNCAMMMLGQIGDQQATEAIIPLLQNKDIASNVCRVLGNLKDRRAVPAMLEVTKLKEFDENEWFRKIFAVALGQIGDPRAIGQLVKLLDDPYFWVRYPAEQALIKMGVFAESSLIEVIKTGKFPANAHAIEALGRMKHWSQGIYQTISKELLNPDWAIRAFAAEALGELDYSQADSNEMGPPLALHDLEKLRQTETHPFVLGKIDWAINRINNSPKKEEKK
ncbi:MAG: HEAT repeat domain-containing protein [Planctomycetota bacterium]